MAERKGDPAVLVDIPQTPNAEEYGKSDKDKESEAASSEKPAEATSSS